MGRFSTLEIHVIGNENKGFDPAEPRDSHGRWTSGGGSADTAKPEASAAKVAVAASQVESVRTDVKAKKGRSAIRRALNIMGALALGGYLAIALTSENRRKNLTFPENLTKIYTSPGGRKYFISNQGNRIYRDTGAPGSLSSDQEDRGPSVKAAKYEEGVDPEDEQGVAEALLAIIDKSMASVGTKHKDYNPSEARDNHGRWTSGGESESAGEPKKGSEAEVAAAKAVAAPKIAAMKSEAKKKNWASAAKKGVVILGILAGVGIIGSQIAQEAYAGYMTSPKHNSNYRAEGTHVHIYVRHGMRYFRTSEGNEITIGPYVPSVHGLLPS